MNSQQDHSHGGFSQFADLGQKIVCLSLPEVSDGRGLYFWEHSIGFTVPCEFEMQTVVSQPQGKGTLFDMFRMK